MGVVGVVFALFTVGYILGVWTACLVFKQPQRAYEEAVPAPSRTRVITLGRAPRPSEAAPALSTARVIALGRASRLSESRL